MGRWPDSIVTKEGFQLPNKRFDRQADKVAREYEKKGVSQATAEKWGRATAAKVAREKEANKTDGG